MAETHMSSQTKMPFSDLPDCGGQPTCVPQPVCPACGGLTCLCRPRFFAGQLLTDADLNRLENYVVEKNRLHNRYLFGSGVACGLEVTCTTCDPVGNRGRVLVQPGYAVSPCGNDIVVCRQESLDICALIERCRPASADDCLAGTAAQCEDAAVDWVLAVCYDEQTARGVTALRSAATRPAGSAGCGCQGNAAAYAPTPSATASPAAAQCEPTLICEGYRFTVYRAPKAGATPLDWGALVKRLICCLEPLFQALGQFPGQQANQSELQDWYLSLKQTARDFIIGEGLYDCEIAQRLAAVADPQGADQHWDRYQQDWERGVCEIVLILGAIVQKCICAALLPPCPDPASADCVPIATLKVRRNPCRVVSVCNLSARQFLMTFPNLQYWLSWIPLFATVQGSGKGRSLRAFIEALCCTHLEDRIHCAQGMQDIILRPLSQDVAADRTAALRMQATRGTNAFATLLAETIAKPTSAVNPVTLLLGAMGATDANAQPIVSDAALAQPAAAVLLGQVLGPAVRTLLTPTAGAVMTKDAAAAPAAEAATLAALQAQLATLTQTLSALQETVQGQQAIIERLSHQ